jgi:hypothetical protein
MFMVKPLSLVLLGTPSSDFEFEEEVAGWWDSKPDQSALKDFFSLV